MLAKLADIAQSQLESQCYTCHMYITTIMSDSDLALKDGAVYKSVMNSNVSNVDILVSVEER